MPRTKGSKNKKIVIEKVWVPEEIVVKVEVPEVKQPKIARLTLDFGREDLNQLKNKMHEILDLVDPL